MLESLTLWNFQTHRKLKIEFDPLVTAILGKTDSGKSSLIRSLKWIILNESPGKSDSFISWGESKSKGKLVVDGKKIIRTKGDGVNSYSLDGKKFTAFGSTVPSDILTELNLGEENFQSQHDPHFWFSKTPGQVSKELNKIVDLEAIDYSLANVASALRKSRSTVEVSEDRLSEAKKQKKDLEWIVEANESWKDIEDRQNDIDSRKKTLSRINQVISEVSSLTKKQKDLSETICELKIIVSRADDLVKRKKELENRFNSVKNLQESEEKVRKLKTQLNEAKAEFVEMTKNKSCPLCGKLM